VVLDSDESSAVVLVLALFALAVAACCSEYCVICKVIVAVAMLPVC
jgi:hypothetical protein